MLFMTVCNKPVKVNQRAVQCDYCDRWHHARCCEINNAVYDALANSSCIWICCDCGLPSFSSSFFDSSSEVQTRNFFSPFDNNGSHNSFITDCTNAQASPSLGSPMQASSPSRKISNKRSGNIARKTSMNQDTLTHDLREPSSSNDSDNDQSSPS